MPRHPRYGEVDEFRRFEVDLPFQRDDGPKCKFELELITKNDRQFVVAIERPDSEVAIWAVRDKVVQSIADLPDAKGRAPAAKMDGLMYAEQGRNSPDLDIATYRAAPQLQKGYEQHKDILNNVSHEQFGKWVQGPAQEQKAAHVVTDQEQKEATGPKIDRETMKQEIEQEP